MPQQSFLCDGQEHAPLASPRRAGRGRRGLPQEDWHKCSILGLASYIALLPVLLALYAAIFDLYMFDTHSGIALTVYGFTIVLLNVFDDLLGSMFYR